MGRAGPVGCHPLRPPEQLAQQRPDPPLDLVPDRAHGLEPCICDFTDPVGLSHPTVSHHMKQLVDAGLAVGEKRGRWTYDRAVLDGLAGLSAALDVTEH